MRLLLIFVLSLSALAQTSLKGTAALKGTSGLAGQVPNTFASRIAGTNVPGGSASVLTANDATGGVIPQAFDSAPPVRNLSYAGQGYCPSYVNGVGCSGTNESSQIAGLDGNAVKFTIPQQTCTDTSGICPDLAGQYFTNFSASPSYTVQFAEGQEFYYQFAEMIGPELLTLSNWVNSEGFKSAIMSEGEYSGQISPPSSCSTAPAEIVIQENVTGALNPYMPILYTNCGSVRSTSFSLGTGEYLDQPMIGTSHYCNAGVPCACGSPAWCYQANQWMVFQVHVKIGNWNTANSTLELWASIAGQPSKLLISYSDWILDSDDVTKKYGKIYLLPYQTNLTNTLASSFVAYDDLIISTRRLPDPNTGVPNAADSLVATVASTTSVTLNWRVNSQNGTPQDDTGFKVEKCVGTTQTCLASQSFSPVVTTAAGASTYTVTSLIHGQAYTFRVKPTNSYGDGPYTGSLCYSTPTGTCGMMATP